MERHKPTRSPQEVMVLCREKDVRAVDLRFTDLIGRQHHLTIPVGQLTDGAFEDGFVFDGWSLQGAHAQDETDLLLMPQAETAWIDPFTSLPTVVLTCSLQDPITREESSRDPRNIARRAENYLLNSGVAEAASFGAELEFFIFDDVSYENNAAAAYYRVNSADGTRSRSRDPRHNRERAVQHPDSRCSHPPIDLHAHLRSEMMQTLIECGIEAESHHHQVATAGQAQIDLRSDTLVAAADAILATKYIIRNMARQHGKTVTFMPKPMWGTSGSGMHVQLALWRATESLFAGNGYAGLSDLGLYAIGGLLTHGPALLALTNPSTNSFKRLVPGAQNPVLLAYSQQSRAAACRVPLARSSPKAKRIEFRCPDASCNPYLAFSAMLMAMIDGIQNKIHPGEPLDREHHALPSGITRGPANDIASDIIGVPQTPRTLDEALAALEQDADFLLRGDVFSEEGLNRLIHHKRQHEIQPLRTQPHPFEFSLYFDV